VPINCDDYLRSFAVAPALTTSSSLVTYAISNATTVQLTFNSSVAPEDVPSGFLERFIHSQIYAAFPDVQSVLHAHTLEVLPFANTALGLRAQMGTAGSVGALGNGVQLFKWRFWN
jgi:ribulose-5-phosphate 4-epimerase/fuculose-1-phosphate aldolase